MTDFEDRKSYAKGSLQDLEHADIMGFLKGWLEEAKAADPDDYNAMTLSTVGRDGHPNARIVLLRSLEQTETGWAVAFYTNYQSEKGLELSEHPFAAATFFWSALERQLRIRGRVDKMSPAESDRYFASRPRESQIGAWASEQSQEVQGRKELQAAWDEQNKRHSGEVPRPAHWGGFLLSIGHIEFWQGRPGRMHDRICATHNDGAWDIARLQP